uniref:Sodium/hydrogen exchanger n=1 Tax=Cyanothece sp. (strain PCC 7425 / ATCC 29141) TaxID=395961 RepID=B8HU36_CYAP4
MAKLTIALILVLAPLIVELNPRWRLPMIVLEIGLGMLVGPYGLNLLQGGVVEQYFSDLGLALLFFITGFEINVSRLRGRPLGLAFKSWLLSLAIALIAALSLSGLGLVRDSLLLATALTTTAIGTLMPVLRDAGELETRFGSFMLAAGAMGELGPLLMMMLVLTGGQNHLLQPLLLLAFISIVAGSIYLSLRYQPPRLIAVLSRTLNTTAQLPVRLCVLTLVGLTTLAQVLGFDTIIGAFAAGMAIALVIKGDQAEVLRQKLDGLGFGVFIPIFFVTTGVNFDFSALTAHPLTLLKLPVFLLLFLLVRGLPVLLYRRDLPQQDLPSLALFSATALPLVVAITNIGVSTGRMLPENATALVGAGMLSVFLFPLLGLSLRHKASAGQ